MCPPDVADGENQNEGEAIDRVLLRATNWNAHRPGAFERVLFRLSTALRQVIAAHLSEEHANLFAEPISDAKTGELRWYAPVEGEAVRYGDLGIQDQTAVDGRVNQLLFDLIELARRLQAEKTIEDRCVGGLLELLLACAYTEKDCLYVVGFQPVFAFWVFESGCTPDVFAPAPTSALAGEEHPRAGKPKSGEPAPTSPRAPWSTRRWATAAGVALVALIAIFGFNPRATVVDWLDRLATVRAREEALVRIIGRDERARTAGVSEAELETEVNVSPRKGESADSASAKVMPPAPEEEEEEFAEPMPPFESAGGYLSIDKVEGSILLMHFWSAADPDVCGEITSFVSFVTSERFDPLRELGGEAYLVTSEVSVAKGNEFLRSCGVQDPFLLRDPQGAILKSIAPAVNPPVSVVFDKLTEHTLATYPRRDWLDPAFGEELQRLFLAQAF